MNTIKNQEPLIPADRKLPEITFKAIVLAIILTIVLTASNAYLALKLGMTVAASIPAAIISMSVLRLFRRHNVLENNIVQTAASAGEALIAPVAFVLPALLVMQYWQRFDYMTIFLISLLGGIMGVLFTVPLRSILLADKTLRFPEGTAIGNVLRVSATGGVGVKFLAKGGLVGAFIAFCQTGLKTLTDGFEAWYTNGVTVFGAGVGYAPALLAAGYIVGIRVALASLLGWIISWIFAVPILAAVYGVPVGQSAADAATTLWTQHIRFIGVGTMLVGGIWTLCTLMSPVFKGIHASIQALKQVRKYGRAVIPRTEKDIPINYVFWSLLVIAIPLFYFLFDTIVPGTFLLTTPWHIAITLIFTLFVIILGFFVAAISGFFAGMLGSSNSPLSGVILATLIICGFLFYALTWHVGYHEASTALSAAAVVTIITAIIGIGAGTSLDTMQDLKSGYMVGATPWKQQVMLIVGTIVAALVAPLALELLFNAYGIGGVYPRAGMDPSQMLAAPQAGLISAVAEGVFGNRLPWTMIITGGIIAVVIIIIDEILKRTGDKRLPPLAVGIGIYLPLTTTAALVVGGMVSFFVNKKWDKQRKNEDQELIDRGNQEGTLLACGLIAGSTLMGVILAIPFVIFKSSDVLTIMPNNFTTLANILGVLSGILLCWWLYHVSVKKNKR